MFEKNTSYLYVGNVARGTDTLAGMAAGSIAIVNEAGTVQTSTIMATDGEFRLVQKLSDGSLIFSPFFNPTKVKNVVGKSYVQPINQVSFLGFNGSSGALDATAAEDFVTNLVWENSRGFYNNSPLMLTAAYRTVAASQKELAFGLQSHWAAALKRQPYKFVKVEVVGDGTVADITGTSTITKVTKGSKGASVFIKDADGTAGMTASTASVTDATVLNVPSSGGRTFTFSAVALGTSAGHHLVVIGETTYLVADAGTNAQNATAIAAAINAGTQATAVVDTAAITVTYNTDFYSLPPLVLSSDDDSTWAQVAVTIASGDTEPVKYQISGTTSAAATFTLTEAYEGETGYVFDGTTDTINTGIATVTNYGLKFTGQENSTFDAVNDTHSMTRFSVTLGNFSTATVTYSQKANEGSGYWKGLANQEVYAQFQDKSPFISAMPRNNYRSEVLSTKDYDLCSFEVSQVAVVGNATGIASYKNFMIQIASATALAGDGVDAALGLDV
jgi:hypothetical protein